MRNRNCRTQLYAGIQQNLTAWGACYTYTSKMRKTSLSRRGTVRFWNRHVDKKRLQHCIRNCTNLATKYSFNYKFIGIWSTHLKQLLLESQTISFRFELSDWRYALTDNAKTSKTGPVNKYCCFGFVRCENGSVVLFIRRLISTSVLFGISNIIHHLKGENFLFW